LSAFQRHEELAGLRELATAPAAGPAPGGDAAPAAGPEVVPAAARGSDVDRLASWLVRQAGLEEGG
jgi:hypothetical protein